MEKLRALHSHVTDGLEKVRAKSWAQPAGQALEVSATIVEGLGSLVPGASMIGGALSFGASLLNPPLTLEDLQNDLADIKKMLEDSSQSQATTRALKREKEELEEKLKKPISEVNDNAAEIRENMQRVFESVSKSNAMVSEEISQIRDLIGETFLMVVDSRYKVN